jgi:hypothetical protein
MNKVGKALACSIALLAGTPQAHATPTDDAGTTTTATPKAPDLIDTFGITSSRFRLTGTTCGNSAYFQVSKTHPAHAQLYQVLMAAHLGGKRVTVRYELISGVCWAKAVNIVVQ